MVKIFSDLSIEAQILIKERFARYNMDGEVVFNDSGIFSDSVKNLSSSDIIEFLDHKDISHIYPKSIYPSLEDNMNNVFLEDSVVNRSRGAEIVSPEEFQVAWEDQIQDCLDLDVNDDGMLDLTGLEDNIDSFSNGINYDLDISEIIDGFF
jgi:hypothetical protein